MKNDFSFKRLLVPGLILMTASVSLLGSLGCVGPLSTRVQKTVIIGGDPYSEEQNERIKVLQAEADAKAKADAEERAKINAALFISGAIQEVKKATRPPEQPVNSPAATEAAAQAASRAAVDDAIQQSITSQIPSGQMSGGDF